MRLFLTSIFLLFFRFAFFLRYFILNSLTRVFFSIFALVFSFSLSRLYNTLLLTYPSPCTPYISYIQIVINCAFCFFFPLLTVNLTSRHPVSSHNLFIMLNISDFPLRNLSPNISLPTNTDFFFYHHCNCVLPLLSYLPISPHSL